MLDKARFEFSPLGKAFSMRLDKTVQGCQGEGVIKLLKDIRDGLRGGNRPNGNVDDRPDRPDDNDDNHMPSLETEEEAAKRTEDFYEQKKIIMMI